MNLNGKAARWTGYGLSGLIVVAMLLDGGIQLAAFDFVTQGMAEFNLPGSWARPLGAITVLCTLLYAVPRTSVLGAILLTGFFGGTIATHLPGKDALLPHIVIALVLGAMTWGGLWLRDPRLRALLPLRHG
jgi:hypothetical protein